MDTTDGSRRMNEELIRREEPAPGVVSLTLNRPDKLNALTVSMFEDLVQELETLRTDLTCRVVIVTGAGRAFTAGLDLGDRSWPSAIPRPGGITYQSAVLLRQFYGHLVPLMRSLPQPIISAVNGAAAGLGLTIVLASDLALAGSSAWFANYVHNAGMSGAELGASFLLQHAVGSQAAAEILLTSRKVSASRAVEIGLVLREVPDEILWDEALVLASEISSMSPYGTWMTKLAMWRAREGGSLASVIEFEAGSQLAAGATTDAKEKRASVREGRTPEFRLE
jgi:enoyl-CoA hydratase/carnithine racemase